MVLVELSICNTDSNTGNDSRSKIFSNSVDKGHWDFRKNTCEDSCGETRAEAGDDIGDCSRTDDCKDHSVGAGATIVIENGKCAMYARMLMIARKRKHAIAGALSKTQGCHRISLIVSKRGTHNVTMKMWTD